MANAIPSYGTILQVDDGSLNFTNIGELRDSGELGFSVNMLDTTVHNDGTPWKSQAAGLITPKPLQVKVNLIPTNATHSWTAGLTYLAANRLRRSFRWNTNSDAGSDYGTALGYVSDVTWRGTTEGLYEADFTITLTGAITWTTT